MKKFRFVFLAVGSFVTFLALIVLFRVGGNHLFAKMVDKEEYYIIMESMEDEERYMGMEESVLETLPYDAYVMDYNMANAYYNDGDYSKAQIYYERCLDFNMPQDKECSVRINLTMTKLQQIGFEAIYSEYEAFEKGEEVDKEALIRNIDDVIEKLQEDREILTEKNCAGEEDDDGHSDDAEALKKDIDNKIEELEKMKEELQKKIDEENKDQNQEEQQDDQQSQDQSSNEQNDDQDQNSDQEQSEAGDVDDEREDDIKEQIKERESSDRKETSEDRRDYDYGSGSQGWAVGCYGYEPDEKEKVW